MRVPSMPKQSVDDREEFGVALRSAGEQLEYLVHYPRRQDLPGIKVHANQPQELLRHHCPVTRIPPEILAYIFELYVDFLEEPTPDGVPGHGPHCLAQVCTLWKAIVESDPRLWTSILFSFAESSESRKEDVQNVQLVLDLHLRWSGILPVSLTFIDHRIYHFDTEGLISLLVDRLRMHASRWKGISLQLSGAYFPLLFTFTPCNLTSLEYLCINGNMAVHAPRVLLHLDLESAAKLKSFHYNGPGLLAGQEVRLPWKRLAEVSFEFTPHYGESYTVSQQIRRLSQCQNITTCSLGIDRDAIFGPRSVINLPRLQTLRVRRLSRFTSARSAIDLLVLPQLQTLEIDASVPVVRNKRWHGHAFSNLLERSRCTLLHLSIQDVDFTNDELLRCLELSPQLMSLRFIPCPRSHDISDVIHKLGVSYTCQTGSLVQGASTGPLIPKLREITLGSSVTEYLDLISAMFRSRVGAHARAARVARLRQANVVFFDMWHDIDVDTVQGPGDRLYQAAGFHGKMMQLKTVSENANESGRAEEEDDELEVSVVVDSPYLPKYIDVQERSVCVR